MSKKSASVTANCPLGGKCLSESIVYKARVTASDGEVKTYTGLTKRTFKDRLYEHRNDANNPKHRTHTKLAGYVWRKKDQNVTIDNYKWEIRKKCFTYQPGGKKCDLCLTEKMLIMKDRDPHSLNQRTELMNSCRHRWMYRFSKIKTVP